MQRTAGLVFVRTPGRGVSSVILLAHLAPKVFLCAGQFHAQHPFVKVRTATALKSYRPPVLLCGVLLELPLVVPAPPIALAGTPPLVVVWVPVPDDAPPDWLTAAPDATPPPT